MPILITAIPLPLDILVLSALSCHKGHCVSICENEALLTLHIVFCFVLLLDLVLVPSWLPAALKV